MLLVYPNFGTTSSRLYQSRQVQQVQRRDLSKELEWLESFDSVVLCFDQDDAGKKAASEVLDCSPNKAKICFVAIKRCKRNVGCR